MRGKNACSPGKKKEDSKHKKRAQAHFLVLSMADVVLVQHTSYTNL